MSLELKVSHQQILLYLPSLLLILPSPFCCKLNLVSLMTLLQPSPVVAVFFHSFFILLSLEVFLLLIAFSRSFSLLKHLQTLSYVIMLYHSSCCCNLSFPPPIHWRFCQKFFSKEILPYLQAEKLTTTVSWMLAEDEMFLGQKQKTILLTAKVVAKVTAFAYIGFQVSLPKM